MKPWLESLAPHPMNFQIFQGTDHFNNRPVYRIKGKPGTSDEDYIGDWTTNHGEAVAECLRMNHPWLFQLANELDVDLSRHVSELNAQDWTPGEIALSLLDCAFPNGTTPESVLRIRCYPWEKSRLVRAARGEKLNEWMRRHLIRAAMESENED